MRKRDELSNPASCLARARDEEMLFVLLARDAAAPPAIRAWVKERIRLGKNREGDEQTTSALECAETMARERYFDPTKPKSGIGRELVTFLSVAVFMFCSLPLILAFISPPSIVGHVLFFRILIGGAFLETAAYWAWWFTNPNCR